jgi:hypothetical protein
MAFSNWAFIYLGYGGEDPTVDRAVIDRGGLKTTVVAVPDRNAAVKVATELVDARRETRLPRGRQPDRAGLLRRHKRRKGGRQW